MNSEIFYDKKIFAENLCRLMKESGERQTDIAKLLKVSKSTVSEYCKGQQMPRMDKIEMLFTSESLSPNYLNQASLQAQLRQRMRNGQSAKTLSALPAATVLMSRRI